MNSQKWDDKTKHSNRLTILMPKCRLLLDPRLLPPHWLLANSFMYAVRTYVFCHGNVQHQLPIYITWHVVKKQETFITGVQCNGCSTLCLAFPSNNTGLLGGGGRGRGYVVSQPQKEVRGDYNTTRLVLFFRMTCCRYISTFWNIHIRSEWTCAIIWSCTFMYRFWMFLVD